MVSRVTLSSLMATRSVTDAAYGATGNGTTDDTAAIQAAINACSAGETLYLPPGTYLVTSTITLKVGVNLAGYFPGDSAGDTSEITTIDFNPTATDTLFDGTAAAGEGSYEQWGNVTGIKILGDGTANSQYAFDWLAPTSLRVVNVRVEGFDHAFRLRDQIFCLFDHVLVNAINGVAGSSAFLFDTQSAQNGTTTTMRNCYLRQGDWCAIVKADSHSRLRWESCIFESTQEGILDLEEGVSGGSVFYVSLCESEGVAANDSGSNQSLFKIGVNGTGSGGVTLNVSDCQFGADNDTAAVTATRVLFEVDRGRVVANNVDINGAGGGVLTTASQVAETSVLRDVYIANDDHPILDFTRGIDDIELVVIDNCGWTGFRTFPGRQCVVEHFDLDAGASVTSTFSIPRFSILTGYQLKVVEAVNEAGTLDFAGGLTTQLNSATPTSLNSIRGRWLVGDPAANTFESNSAATTAVMNATTTWSAGRVIIIIYYESLPNMSASL